MQPTFIEVYENAVPDGLCDRLIEKHKDLYLNTSSTADYGQDRYANGNTKRKDVSYYFEGDAPALASEVNACLDGALIQYLDKYPSLAMHQFYSQTVKVQKTPPKGGFHAWHCENPSRGNNTRMLVWMVYLNDTPEGEGTTEFLEYGLSFQPKKGSVVLFPSHWTHTHRGNPVYTTDKYIATGWYYLNGD